MSKHRRGFNSVGVKRRRLEVGPAVGVFTSGPVLPAADTWLCFAFTNDLYFLFFTEGWGRRGRVCFSSRTQEEVRVREEDQQTITVEVELKRPDSEPSIMAPQPEIRY